MGLLRINAQSLGNASLPSLSDLTSRAGDGPGWLQQGGQGPKFTLEKNF